MALSKLLFTAIMALLLTDVINSCPNEKNCAACKSLKIGNVCGKCFNSIYSRSYRGCDETQGNVPNCVEYVEQGYPKCLRCQFGYGLDAQSKCHKCAEANCAICNDSPNKCTSCYGGIVPRNSCQDSILEYCRDQNCDVCDQSSEVCLKCKDNFSFNDYLSCVEGMEGCHILDRSNRNKCLLCQDAYYLSSAGTCIKNANFDYPFYKSFWFWLFLLVVVFATVFAQISYMRHQDKRMSNVSGSMMREDSQAIQSENEAEKNTNLLQTVNRIESPELKKTS